MFENTGIEQICYPVIYFTTNSPSFNPQIPQVSQTECELLLLLNIPTFFYWSRQCNINVQGSTNKQNNEPWSVS